MITNNNKDNKGIIMITKSQTSTVFNLDNCNIFQSSWGGSKVIVLNDNNQDNKEITRIANDNKITNFHSFNYDGKNILRAPGKVEELWYQMITNNNKDSKKIIMITKSLKKFGHTFHHPRITKFGTLFSWPILGTSAKQYNKYFKDNKGITMRTKS